MARIEEKRPPCEWGWGHPHSNKMSALLEVKNLVKYFPITRSILFSKQIGAVKAVDGVSFEIKKGQTLGLVGESGCGKSTLGLCILRLIEPTAGEVIFEGTNILSLSQKMIRPLRQAMQVIFQDPFASLDPRKRIIDIIGEPLSIHNIVNGKEKDQRVQEMMEIVGLSSRYIWRYPHEFSGGQRQRIAIARALCLNPKIIICDEPVSALDVSVQAQIINLMQDLQKKFDVAYLFISHDLSVVKHISDRIAVMYLGKLVELTDKKTLYKSPLHPYTKALISAVPAPDPQARRKRTLLEGDVPSPINPPKGCRFHNRCPETIEICKLKEPALVDIGQKKEHYLACHVVQKALPNS